MRFFLYIFAPHDKILSDSMSCSPSAIAELTILLEGLPADADAGSIQNCTRAYRIFDFCSIWVIMCTIKVKFYLKRLRVGHGTTETKFC